MVKDGCALPPNSNNDRFDLFFFFFLLTEQTANYGLQLDR